VRKLYADAQTRRHGRLRRQLNQQLRCVPAHLVEGWKIMKIEFVNYAAMTRVGKQIAEETLKVQQMFEKEREERIMNKSVCIVGPMGCGKTRNAEAIKKHFALDFVVDDFDRTMAFSSHGGLYITNSLQNVPYGAAMVLYFDIAAQLELVW
jgi:hypothetical protein